MEARALPGEETGYGMTDAEYAEAIALARASVGNGGQRTFLAKALLRANAALESYRTKGETDAR